VVAALAAAIGMTALDSIDTIAPARTLVTVTDAQRLANSTAAVREQGAALPVIVGISHVSPSLHSVGYATTEYVGISHVAPRSVGYAGSAELTSGPTTHPCPLACQEARR
jgi:hypothetical protein